MGRPGEHGDNFLPLQSPTAERGNFEVLDATDLEPCRKPPFGSGHAWDKKVIHC
jgi:hypothetical protein